jgi:tetratricopeptide (TPR) repeat protein
MLLTISLSYSQNKLEKEIFEAYDKSVSSQTDQFQPIIDRLNTSFIETKDPIYDYWIAFAMYRQSILFMTNKNEKKALKILQKGIERLEKSSYRNSEILALQGSMLSFSINFQSDLAAIISAKANILYNKAIQENDNNLRAYLGVGRSDYYKPTEYGGGLKVESFLKQALNKPDKSYNHALAPTWGRNQVYYYLASYYEKENRIGEAKLFCSNGLKLFPDDRQLNELKKVLGLN